MLLIGAPSDAEGFAPGYDLLAEEFSLLSKTSTPTTFPLRWIYDTTNMLNFRTSLLARPYSRVLQPHLDELVDAFTKYRIPVVTLKDLSSEEVCPIFEGINSSGTKLSIYDLMVARHLVRKLRSEPECHAYRKLLKGQVI